MRSDDLEDFLGSSGNHIAVIPEVTAFETYKTPSTQLVAQNLAHCCRYPRQVLTLRSTSDIVLLEAPRSLSADEYVEPVQTAGFASFCAGLDRGVSGDQGILNQIEAHRATAGSNVARVKLGHEDIVRAVVAFRTSLSRSDVASLGRNEPPSRAVIGQTWALIKETTEDFFERSYAGSRIAVETSQGTERFLFRFALASACLVLWWIRHGGIEGVSQDRLANDALDMQQVAFATKFDGLLTGDTRMREIYAEASAILAAIQERLRKG